MSGSLDEGRRLDRDLDAAVHRLRRAFVNPPHPTEVASDWRMWKIGTMRVSLPTPPARNVEAALQGLGGAHGGPIGSWTPKAAATAGVGGIDG